MTNFNVERHHVEGLILSCYLNVNKAFPLDRIEIEDYIIPFELFTANRTNKLVAKAIYNFQKEKMPIDEVLIYDYITSKTTLEDENFTYLATLLWVGFDTMLKYIEMLKEIDKNEKLMERLKALR